MRKNTAIIGHEYCQSPVSLDTLQKDCKRPVHRRFVSLSVSITKIWRPRVHRRVSKLCTL